MGCLIARIRTKKRQNKDEPDIDTAAKNMEQQVDRLSNEIEQTELQIKEESDMKRKQSLRARLRRQETILDRVEKQKERLEEESVQRMLRLASNVSQDAMPPTAAAIRTNAMFRRQADLEESIM